VNIHEERIRGPTSLFTDGVTILAIELHRHGAAGSEQVAADESCSETTHV
jgi:hypothetical protein